MHSELYPKHALLSIRPAEDKRVRKQKLDDLKRRAALAESMSGEEKLARQHTRGKLNARETRPLLCEFAELAQRQN